MPWRSAITRSTAQVGQFMHASPCSQSGSNVGGYLPQNRREALASTGKGSSVLYDIDAETVWSTPWRHREAVGRGLDAVRLFALNRQGGSEQHLTRCEMRS